MKIKGQDISEWFEWVENELEDPRPVPEETAYMLEAFLESLSGVGKQAERIKELEAQVPKTVNPEKKPHVSGYGSYSVCACAEILDEVWRHNFCPHCGSKLNWEDSNG